MKPIELPATDRHIAIYDEDWEWLHHMFGKPGGVRPTGTARVIRNIVHKHVKAMRQKIIDQQERTESPQRSEANVR